MTNTDGFVKNLKSSVGVIPAKAEIQYFQIVLDACLRRHDGFGLFTSLSIFTRQNKGKPKGGNNGAF